MFFYSERPGTLAAKNFQDDIEAELKQRRLTEVIEKQTRHSAASNKRDTESFQSIDRRKLTKNPTTICKEEQARTSGWFSLKTCKEAVCKTC